MRTRSYISALALACSVPSTVACSTSATDGAASAIDTLRMEDLPVVVTSNEAGVFDQELDHPREPAPSLGTFAQRYWYSTEFADGPESPVLFVLCGESECGPRFLGAFGDTAKVLHASIVALEHRYYGASLPFTEFSIDKMKYLSIHNALEDAAAFERFAKASLPLRGKWIAVGGSYAGMLAAFYREKHPELAAGAWASSAPVNVQKSFTGYDLLVSRALGPTCLLLFQQAVDAAARAYDIPSERNALSQALFGTDWPDAWGKERFLSTFSSYAAWGAQYGKQGSLCAALQQHSMRPLDGFVAFVKPPLASEPGEAPVSDRRAGGAPSPWSTVASTEDRGLSPLGPSGFGRSLALVAGPEVTQDTSYKSWFYQVCTEVGFYQVANPDRTASVMLSSSDEASFDSYCDQLVGQRPDVEKTRAEYYAPIVRGEVSNVFWVNGALDPWSALSFTDPSRPPGDSTVFVIQQGSHCNDLSNLKPDTAVAVFEAHAKFVELARRWLAE